MFGAESLLKLIAILGATVVVAILAFLFVGWPQKTPHVEYGATWSRPYAEELGLDPDETLRTALDDIGIRRYRVAAYWKLIQPEPETWDFSLLDKDIEEIAKRDGKIILAVGEKLPRWPECWGPDWWKKLSREEQRQHTLRYIETVVQRYRDNPAIIAWQVENEPHFAYGDCPAPDYLFIQHETEFVRGLDPTRPIQTTDSGELSSWVTLGAFVDKLGVSVYRVVRNPILGDLNFHYWFVPPYLYKRKAILLRPFGVKELYVSEFQMEPWSNKSLPETPIEDQLTSMNIKQLRANFSFAERMGVSAVDFWGFEWWVWMRDHGHPEFVEEAASFWAR
ncbi:beta-galactosidase [Patescibacteria group bacterium]|nr:beta-galactosidase [Patescibacteria group bacterium]